MGLFGPVRDLLAFGTRVNRNTAILGSQTRPTLDPEPIQKRLWHDPGGAEGMICKSQTYVVVISLLASTLLRGNLQKRKVPAPLQDPPYSSFPTL